MRARSVFALGALSLACNSVLGITDTSLRDDASSAGNGGNSSMASGGASACSSHTECTKQSGEYNPSACIAGRCIELMTPECPILLPVTERRWLANLRSSDAEPVIFGAFSPVNNGLMGMESRNYDLVLTEVSREAGGIPAAGGKRRPVLAVVCNALYESREGLDHAIDHLVQGLQVPGILAGLEAKDLEYAFRRTGHDNHVFFMSPLDADRSLVELVDDGLVWSMLSGGEQLAPAYGPLMDRALAYMRRMGTLGPNELARVALLTTEDVSPLNASSEALTSGMLRFNGQSARANAPDYFREISIASSALSPTLPDYAEAIRSLREFAPHVVIGNATTEFLSTFIPALESEVNNPQPFYVLSPWHYKHQLIPWLLGQFKKINRRMAGINYAAALDSTVYDAYQARFDAAYPAFAGTMGNENYYDAGYFLIHATAAAGTVTPLLGSDIVNGMRRLLSGRLEFSVGPSDLLPIYRALETPGSSIVLNGAMGPPNFDPRTGARQEPGSVWCIDDSARIHADVLRVDAAGSLTGNFPCFDLGEP